jgi:hypothetical protein
VTPAITLYVRPQCRLCDEAAALLARLRPRFGFDMMTVDITTDPALESRYLFEIPVVALDGREIARAPIRAGDLEDALETALGARHHTGETTNAVP